LLQLAAVRLSHELLVPIVVFIFISFRNACEFLRVRISKEPRLKFPEKLDRYVELGVFCAALRTSQNILRQAGCSEHSSGFWVDQTCFQT
jgi:hypothetical protein